MTQIWVGSYYEKTLIFDPSWRNESSNFVLFWDANSLGFALYPATMARKRIRKAATDVASVAISCFDKWVDSYGSKLSDLSQVRREAKLFALDGDLTLDERHEKHLIRFGVPYRRSQKTTMARFRTTHCWACKQSISTTTDHQCLTCAWILCNCGACGCGYQEAL
jgi:hypothetical protein